MTETDSTTSSSVSLSGSSLEESRYEAFKTRDSLERYSTELFKMKVRPL